MVSFLTSIEEYAADLEAIGAEPAPAPRWNQDWFPRLDAAAAYAMVPPAASNELTTIGPEVIRVGADASTEMR